MLTLKPAAKTYYYTILAWRMLFKASSFIPLEDERTWSDLWIDSTFTNDNDSDALVNQPGRVYKSPLANSWDDNSNYSKVD